MEQAQSVFIKLAEKIMMPNSRIIPELFAMLVSEQDAQILLALPGTAEELAQKFSMDRQAMQKKLDELFLKGVAFKNKRPEGTRYKMVREVVQFHDATILWPDAPQAYYDAWQRFMETEWPDFAKIVGQMLPKPVTRIIPVEKALSPRAQILSHESCSEVIDKSAVLAVTKCTCRLIAHKCSSPIEVCIQEGKAAQYAIERGTGRQISKEEAREIIRKAEEAGLVHVTMNRSKDFHYICNCCGCCCIAMPVMIQHGARMVDPSRYLAEVDTSACTACGTCVDRCWFSALSMDGEKAVVDAEKCLGCGVCQVTCPTSAISLVQVRGEDFIPAA